VPGMKLQDYPSSSLPIGISYPGCHLQKIHSVRLCPLSSSAGLRARQAEKRESTASTLIHAIVTVCTRWIRRIATGELSCSIEAIHSIMALYSHALRSKATCTLPLG
jgi:hypothetical protein